MKKLVTLLCILAITVTATFGQAKVFELKLAHADPKRPTQTGD